MKFSININQFAVQQSGLDLDLTDGAILDFVKNWITCSKAERIQCKNESYVWISHELVLNQMPMIRLKKDSLYRRMSRLCNMGLLKLHPDSQSMQKSFYAITELFDQLNFSTPPDSNPYPSGFKSVPPTDSNPEYNIIDNNKTNKKEKSEILTKEDQLTDQLAKCYYPNLASYQMGDAMEKLNLFLSLEENLKYVRENSRTRKTDEQIRAYVRKFVIASFDTQYIKYIQQFPQLLTRFCQWLSRDREQKPTVHAKEKTLEEFRDEIHAAMPEDVPQVIKDRYKDMDIGKFKDMLDETIKYLPKVSKMKPMALDEYALLAFQYGLKSNRKKYLLELLEKIEMNSWLQNFNKLTDAINRADNEK